MIAALDSIEVITLFVDDFQKAKVFYETVFAVETIYQDDVSQVFRFGGLLVNLLQAAQAPQLIVPYAAGNAQTGVRALLTIKVENVDAICDALLQHGVALLNGPVDRPWGRRTAAFADPSGHVWEIAENLPPAAAVHNL